MKFNRSCNVDPCTRGGGRNKSASTNSASYANGRQKIDRLNFYINKEDKKTRKRLSILLVLAQHLHYSHVRAAQLQMAQA